MAVIKLPDGSKREVADGSSVMQVAESIGRGLAKAAVAGKVDGKVVDLSSKIDGGEHCLQILTDRDPEALYVVRHSAAHVMAEAIQRIWPQAQLAYGPALETGFYYDIALDAPISANDFTRIEAEMEKIVAENRPFTRYQLPLSVGMQRLKNEGNKYKYDNAQRAIEGGAKTLSWYLTGKPAKWKLDDGTEVYSLFEGFLVPIEADRGNVIDTESSSQLRTGAVSLGDANWEDLCMGPHVPSTGKIKAFKVMSVAQSHWHGDVSGDKFQRVYGTAFFDNKHLDEHLKMLDEAKKRDHRVLGPQLGLFALDDAVGPGLILWKPKGAIVRQELQNFIMEHLRRQGYSQVFTPHIGRRELYIRSGHYPYYMASQFPEMRQITENSRDLLIYLRKLRDKQVAPDAELEKNLVQQADMDDRICCSSDVVTKLALAREQAQTGENYLLKPMNCPHHIAIFASEPHSYRDMPVRLAEFGTVYRWEKSGELGGMTRVRGFTQDDAHLFCTEEQVPAEVQGCLELVKIVLGTLGMSDYRVRVGLRDADSNKYVGKSEQWDRAEAACLSAAEKLGVPFTKEPGEAAFYGPKIDFVVKDVIGREWQLGTVQVDYQLPERFDLSYVGADNKPHRPVMIHRAPFGSMERFVAVLIEHFAGVFPLWLAPVQVAAMTISEKFLDYGQHVIDALKSAGLRVEPRFGPEKIGAKIRDASMEKIPYLLILGEQEATAGKVAVRGRGEKPDQGQMSLTEFIERCQQEIATRGATRATPASPTTAAT